MKTLGVLLSKQYRFIVFTVLAFGLTTFASDPAHAAGGGWGSSGGGYASSGGSWGSNGGSFGSSGSVWVRPTPIRNMLSRVHARLWNSSGGSCGGSRGVWVARRSLGSSGSWSGSTGSYSLGSSVSYPPAGSFVRTANPNCYYGLQGGYPLQTSGNPTDATTGEEGLKQEPAPGDTVPEIESPGPDPSSDGTSIRRPDTNTAVLNLVLPEEAKIFINNRLTKTTGSLRSYVSRNLGEDRDYKYHVKAVLVRDGQEVVRTKLVKMRPGLTKTVKFEFDEYVMTTLALEVPADAKVKICGKQMLMTGPVRSFTTNRLKDGEVWKDYKVTVEFQRNGKPHVEERSIDLLAGDLHRLSIGVDTLTNDQVASK